jgi:hypothetical protein
MISGSDQAIGSARQTSPRLPLLCESVATRPSTRHRGPATTSQGRASRHAAKSPTDSRNANNPWYEMSHARRYAPIVSAPSTLAFRSERLLRVAQTASTKPIVTHGAMPAPTTMRGPTICLRNCAVMPERRPARKAPARMPTLRDATGRVAGRCTSFLVRCAISTPIPSVQSGLFVDGLRDHVVTVQEVPPFPMGDVRRSAVTHLCAVGQTGSLAAGALHPMLSVSPAAKRTIKVVPLRSISI